MGEGKTKILAGRPGWLGMTQQAGRADCTWAQEPARAGSVQGLAASLPQWQGTLSELPACRKLGPNEFVKAGLKLNS